MKKHRKGIFSLKIWIGLFALAILVYNCQVDEHLNDKVALDVEDESAFVNIDEIPKELALTIESFETSGKSSKNDIDAIKIDTEQILKMVDSLGNTNYSLNFILSNTPKNVLYNLALSTSEDNVQEEPFVLKYTIDNLDDILSDEGEIDFLNFQGTVNQFYLTDFLNEHTSKTYKRDCPPYRFNNGGGTDDSSGGSSTNTSTRGGSGCYGYIFSSGGHIYAISILGCSGNAQKSAKNDCPNRAGGSAGINSGGGSNSSVYCPNGRVIGNECVEYDDEQVFNKLTGKADCVYEKLKSKNGNLFKKTIAEFIDDPKYNLTFQNGDCPRTDEACTNASNINNIVITIENTNQNSLGIAAAILHEGIHAEMHRYVSRYKSGVDPNNRARLLQLYAYYKGYSETVNNPGYRWLDDAHHVYMVENYVKPIASAVRNIDGNKYPLNYYMAYGWDGLRDTGYDIAKLTETQNSTNNNLREIVKNNFDEKCN